MAALRSPTATLVFQPRVDLASGRCTGAEEGADPTEQTLERLRTATREASPVWVGYVAADGSRTERELAPLDLSGGTVRAVDRSSAQVVTIPLARISFVGEGPRAPLD